MNCLAKIKCQKTGPQNHPKSSKEIKPTNDKLVQNDGTLDADAREVMDMKLTQHFSRLQKNQKKRRFGVLEDGRCLFEHLLPGQNDQVIALDLKLKILLL